MGSKRQFVICPSLARAREDDPAGETVSNTLKSWRELLAAPLPEAPKGGGSDSDGNSSDKSDKRTNPDLLRVDLSETTFGQIPKSSDKLIFQARPRLVTIGPRTWAESDWSKGICVYCPVHLAPGDVIACANHREQMDAVLMPWEAQP